MKLTNQENVEIKDSTKLFEGFKGKRAADEQAERQKSYVFMVFKEVRNKETRRKETVFYGYGVSK